MKLFLSKPALQDLVDVWELIAAENEGAADAYIKGIHARTRLLLSHPELGRRRDDIAPGVRGLVYRKHLIFYVIAPGRIDVARVLHGARDLPAAFVEGPVQEPGD